MAAGDREATFTLKAADLSSQPINQIIAVLEKLTAAQAKLNDASKAGIANTNDSKQSIQGLESVFGALEKRLLTLIEFNRALDEAANRVGRVADLADKREKLVRSQNIPEDKKDQTKEQREQLREIDKEINSANRSADSATKTLNKMRDTLAGMGESARTVAGSMAQVNAAIQNNSEILAKSRQIFLEQPGDRQRAKEAAEQQAAAARAEAEEIKRVGQLREQEQVRVISLIRQRKEAEAEAAAAADRAAADQIKNIRQMREAEQLRVISLTNQRQEAEAQRQQAAQALAQQRNQAAQAQQSIPERQPLGVSATPVQGFSSTAQEIEGIIAPAAQARATLTGLEAEIAGFGAAMQKTGLRTEAYLKLQRQLGLALAELRRQAKLVDAFQAQEEVTRRAETEQRKQVATLEALVVRVKNATVAEEGFARELKAAEAAARQATVTLNIENEALARLRNGLDAAGISYLNLDAASVRLKTAAGVGKQAFDELSAKAEKAGQSIILGLNPYHLQIVADHLDAVMTQVNSGISLSQIAAQHSGQLFQDFQLQLLGVAKSIAEIPFGIGLATSAIALLTAGVLALIRALDEASESRLFASQLALNVDGARFSVEKLVGVSKGIEKLGIDLDEATKGARSLAAVGFSEEQLRPLLSLAAKLSIASGGTKTFAEAVKDVGTAFGGSYEALRKFDNEYNALSSKTADKVRRLFEKGLVDEGRALAFEEMGQRANDAADKARGAWARFFVEFKNGYHDVLDFLASKIPVLGEGIEKARPFAEVTPQSAVAPSTGGTQAGGTARGDRNNNPGNLEFAHQEGAVKEGGPSPRFAQFIDLETGVAAALRQYLIYQDKYGLKSIKEMVEKATPPKYKGGENDNEVVRKYIDAVAAQLGVKTTDAINLRDRNTAIKYVQAVAQQEGNKPPSEAVAQAGVGRVLGRTSPDSILPPGETGTEGRTKATDDFVRDIKRQTDALKDLGLTGQAAIDRGEEQLAHLKIKLLDDAAKFAEKEKQTDLDRKRTAEAVEAYIDAKRREFTEERLKREIRVSREINSLGSTPDKTDLNAQLGTVNDKFNTMRERITEQFKGVTGAQQVNGKNLEETLADVEKLRQIQIEKVTSQTAQAVFDATIKKFQDEVKIAQELLTSDLPDKVTQGLAKMQHALGELGPAARKAFQEAEKASANLPQTPEVLARRQKNERELAQTNRPAEVSQFTDKALGGIAKGVSEEQTVRDKQLEALGSEIKGGSKGFHDALQAGLAIIKDTGPAYRKAIADANADYERIRTAPTSTLSEKSKAVADIAANNARLAKSDSEALEKVITEALKDDQERLAHILKERDEAIKKINERALRGLDSPVQTAAKLAKAKSEYDPQVAAASGAIVRDTTEARAQSGLSEGFRARLSEQQTAAEGAGDTKLFDAEIVKTQVAAGLSALAELRSYIKETEHEQTQLQKLGQATTESTEAARRAAYAKTNTEAAKIIPTLRKVIDEAEKLGQITPAAAAKARASIADFNTETKYATKFQEDLIKTIEGSVESRGVQAFDTIAQSIGNLITAHGKLKDVVTATGQAFAQFAAGVLQDVAKMIIKLYLLKAVQTLVGMIGGGFGSTGSAATNIAAGGGSVGETALGGAVDSNLSSLGSSVVHHSGGMVGGTNGVSRVVDLSLFREARRMHSGGTVGGLAADEMPAILQKGEQVLSKSQVRNMQSSSGSNSGSGGQVRNVLAVGDKEIAQAMNSSHGEKVVLNVLKRNAPSVRQMLG